MENRRPPRNSSYGQNPQHGRPPRQEGNRSSFYSSDSTRRPPSRNSSEDSRYNSRDNSPGSRRPSAGPGRGGPNKFDPRGRFGTKPPPRPQKAVEVKPPVTSDTQLTDGKFRAKELALSASPLFAPTARKLREILFKVISRRVKAGRFLDLGAGAGTMGLEAISRGAMCATFVERSARACTYIKKNLAQLEIKEGHGEVIQSEIEPFLKQVSRRKRRWDLVYFGACQPQSEAEAIEYFSRGIPIEKGGLLMIEHSSDREFPETLGSLRRWRIIVNGFATITFYERK